MVNFLSICGRGWDVRWQTAIFVAGATMALQVHTHDASAQTVSQSAVQPAAVDPYEAKNALLEKKIDAMQQQMQALNQAMAELRQEQANQMKEAVLRDAETRSKFPGGDVTAGYEDGFYLRQGDDFKIKVNGLLDARYTYVNAENHTTLKNTPLGTAHTGDTSGFSLNMAQIAISGTVYQHVLFKFMGNFGSTSSFTAPTAGTFQLNDAWGAYSVSPALNFRAGTFIIPFMPLRSIANYGGQEFPDASDVATPFSVGYGLGADIYGLLDHEKLTYDLMINDGSSSQNAVDSAAPAAGRDNRLGGYGRIQFAGAGKISDFYEDPDLAFHQNLVWIVGGGLGFESQNSDTNAFPGPRTTTTIPGLSAASGPGFVPTRYVLDGNLYRATLDFRTKYQGWSTSSTIYYQAINSESGAIIPKASRGSVSQLSYFVQSGYFLIPHKFEVAGRFGELFTLDFPHHMDEYTIGLNYYLFNENLKVQAAETFIPQTAAFTSGYGSFVNTQDWITELQLQMKF